MRRRIAVTRADTHEIAFVGWTTVSHDTMRCTPARRRAVAAPRAKIAWTTAASMRRIPPASVRARRPTASSRCSRCRRPAPRDRPREVPAGRPAPGGLRRAVCARPRTEGRRLPRSRAPTARIPRRGRRRRFALRVADTSRARSGAAGIDTAEQANTSPSSWIRWRWGSTVTTRSTARETTSANTRCETASPASNTRSWRMYGRYGATRAIRVMPVRRSASIASSTSNSLAFGSSSRRITTVLRPAPGTTRTRLSPSGKRWTAIRRATAPSVRASGRARSAASSK